jgi:CRP-like cAMP-binding protein
MAMGRHSSSEGASALLRQIPLFEGLEPHILERTAGYLHLRNVERGQWVLRKGNSGDQLLFLLSGQLQVVDVTEAGRDVGLNFLLPGDYFGELSVIDGLPRTASVVATANSQIAALPRAQALELFYHQPLVAERVLMRMAKSIRRASDYRSILAIPNAFQRVYAFLHQMKTVAPGGLTVIERLPTQQEMAIMINTSRETVSRAMQILNQKGVVEKDLRRLIVRKPDVLKIAISNSDF